VELIEYSVDFQRKNTFPKNEKKKKIIMVSFGVKAKNPKLFC